MPVGWPWSPALGDGSAAPYVKRSPSAARPSAHPIPGAVIGGALAALGLIIGGAIGNLVDRLRFGAVTDFLDFHVWGYSWPAFNLADSGITVGAIVLILDTLFVREETP